MSESLIMDNESAGGLSIVRAGWLNDGTGMRKERRNGFHSFTKDLCYFFHALVLYIMDRLS